MAQTLYHGDATREHHFWIYPIDTSLPDRRWDAHNPSDLCNNYTLLSIDPFTEIQTYQCNGHEHECHNATSSIQHGFHENYNAGITSGVIALRSNANGRFVCAENGGNKPLIANRDNVAAWETFDLIVLHGHNVALRSHANGQYVCADKYGYDPLIASRTKIDAWETFRMINCNHEKVAFIAVNGKYVCADNGGNGELIANRSKPESWETFDLVRL